MSISAKAVGDTFVITPEDGPIGIGISRTEAATLYAALADFLLTVEPAKAEPAPGLSETQRNEVRALISNALCRTVVGISGDNESLDLYGWGVDDAKPATLSEIVKAAKLELSIVGTEVALTLNKEDIGSIQATDIIRAAMSES